MLLWRYLAADVLRVMLLAGAGLVGVIAFAAAMRPLAEGRVGPVEAVRLMGLLSVPMLQFALPFAAGLAATLAYHRFAAENEAAASMSGGISHKALLLPVAAIGLVLAVLLAALSFAVIPRFLRAAEQILTRDVTRFIINPIERGETVQLGRWDIRADKVIHAARDVESAGRTEAAPEHLVMRGVLAHQVGKPDSFIEADRVDLWLSDDGGDEEGGSRAVLRFNEARVYSQFNQVRAQGAFTEPLRVPSAFRDDPKYLSFTELLAVRSRPEMLNRIDWRRRNVADRLAMHDMIADIRSQLAASGKAVLLRRGDVFTISASRLDADAGGWLFMPAEGADRVRVDIALAASAASETPGPVRSQSAGLARLAFRDATAEQAALGAATPAQDRVWLRLELESVATLDQDPRLADSKPGNQLYSGLTTHEDHVAARLAESTPGVLASAALIAGAREADDELLRAAKELDTKVNDLRREVVSKLHERVAFSLSCLLMVLTGAVMALHLKDALPLSVYLWSFFPALACVITISAGQGLTHKLGSPGLLLLWGGVAALALFTVVAYSRLVRH